jgi:hypothetical protein
VTPAPGGGPGDPGGGGAGGEILREGGAEMNLVRQFVAIMLSPQALGSWLTTQRETKRETKPRKIIRGLARKDLRD